MRSADSPLDLGPLARHLGPAGLLTDADDMAPHLVDWRNKLHGKAIAVVRPSSVDEVTAVVRFARDKGVSLVPQGGNTGLCGGATPNLTGRQLVLSLSRLARIRDVDPLGNTMIVEAGCILANVQQAAAEAQRLFPLSLAAEGSSQIGGLVSTNAGGTAVLRYGNMRDLVLGLEVVLPDGRLWSQLSGLRKDNTGYDLKQLFIGAEGTLGIVTAATLKLFSRPSQVATALATVPGLEQATRLLRHLQADWGEAVTTFEIASHAAIALVRKHFPELRMPLQDGPYHCLFELGVGGRSGTDLNEQVEASLADAFEAGFVTDATVAQNATQARDLWRLREEITESEKREGASVKHDVSVAIGQLPAFVEACTRAVESQVPGSRVLVFGHLGDGSLHINVLTPPGPAPAPGAAGATAMDRTLYDLVHGLAVEHGGSFSAEHGIGQLKRGELQRYKDAVALDVMRQLKQALDPGNIMNPGKVL